MTGNSMGASGAVASHSVRDWRCSSLMSAAVLGCMLFAVPASASEPAAPSAGAGEAEAAPAPPAMPGVLVTPTRPLPPGLQLRRRPQAPPSGEGAMPGCRGPVDEPLELMV